ncbi:response regulator transcription factor [Nonomuraea sp. NN258]|uniref:response regulator transcription factor n=1 Tax=Nonomuraea antri TaxID=2730852 RepID=UPI0015693C0E|nr:response regulator transcription factor [Nonomuraea antri]NRQ35402.1 response regulator transcription factor [Nonomuraea antri]
MTTLSSVGYEVEVPDDVLAWMSDGRQDVVLLTLESEQDWRLLEKLRDTSRTHLVIALIGEESAVLGLRALGAGARSVLLRGVSEEALRRAVAATLDGQAVMPASVAAELAAGATGAAASARAFAARSTAHALTREQLTWLRELAAGSTVARLADQVGYSERAMFRMLQILYKEMGVRSRIQAIVRAQEQGWLRDDAQGPNSSNASSTERSRPGRH